MAANETRFSSQQKIQNQCQMRTLNPIYTEEFHFEPSPHDLNKQSIIITILGKSNDFLGSLIIGFNSKGERLQQWLDCIRCQIIFMRNGIV
ncbi:Double C2-like domain-containing protein beta [Lucilia cuprina]|nr:Double C2-like domain-containing protein beta [Lucilia cuprina]